MAQAQVDPTVLATVFSSSSGECGNCHAMCEALEMPAPVVSPTKFTNSVHNASSGALPCHSCVPCMKSTPRPMSVLITMQMGLPR